MKRRPQHPDESWFQILWALLHLSAAIMHFGSAIYHLRRVQKEGTPYEMPSNMPVDSLP